jgi:hypothetical protein
MPQSKNGSRKKASASKTAKSRPERDAVEPAGPPVDAGGSTESPVAAAPAPAAIPEDLIPEIEYASEANKQFQLSGMPQRIAVRRRRGGPVFQLVGHVVHREVTKAELAELLKRA